MSNKSANLSEGFVYSIKVEKFLPHFVHLPEHMQGSIERHIVSVIYDSFVIPADEDYLMARLLAQKGMYRGFFWAASQAIEKYLKAFLLMHDEGVKGFSKGHPLKKLFEAAFTLDSEIANISLAHHGDMKIDSSVAAHITVFSVDSYIDELTTHGSAANRYNASGVDFNTGHLFALDILAHSLRSKIGVPKIEDSFKSIKADLIKAFYDNNYPFALSPEAHSAAPSPEFTINLSMRVTHLDYLRKNNLASEHSIALQWLEEKMKL